MSTISKEARQLDTEVAYNTRSPLLPKHNKSLFRDEDEDLVWVPYLVARRRPFYTFCAFILAWLLALRLFNLFSGMSVGCHLYRIEGER